MSRPTPSQHSSFPPSSTPSPTSTTTEGLVLRGGAAHFLPGAGDGDANGGLGPAVRGLDLAIGQGQARGHGQAQGSGSGENGTIRRRSRYMEEEGGDRHERDGENHSQTTPSSSGVINENTPLLGGGVDAGYRGDTTRGPAIGIYEPTEDSPSLAKDESAQRMYLAGPNNSSNSLFEPLRRPSPLQRNMSYSSTSSSSPSVVEPGLLNPENITISSLPSPAISLGSVDEPLLFRRGLSTSPSITSDSQAPWPSSAPTTQDLFTHPDVPEEFTYDSTPSRPRPRAYTLSHSAFGSYGVFPSTARDGTPLVAPTLSSRIRLFGLQAVANTASAGFLVLIVIWALSSRGIQASLRWVKGEKTFREKREWDDEEKWKKEKVVKDIQYYARECGFDIEEQIVTTKDGYLLKVFKVSVLPRSGTEKLGKLKRDGRKGFPVLIQHGLFQSCGSFITSEERSLAFWLAEHGDYQVYLGNNRGVFDMGHVQLSRGDPRFWDYNIKELALYDLPAMVDHIRRETGYDKIAFIGHSQGNATMFCSLAQGMVPELGEKLSIFIALAPAVYAGPLTTGFPFGALKSMKWRTWRKWFGVLDFIPLMRISYDYVPSTPFGLLGYQMFAFLFNWTDTNWLLRRKPKMFRFTPSPVSSASIFWWTGYNGFSTRGCVLDPTVDKWFDKRFPPLAIHYGGKDFLVLTDPLLARLKEHEKDVKVVRVQRIAEAEHCDHFWHIDAVEFCFQSFLEDIEKTRPRYPEEE